MHALLGAYLYTTSCQFRSTQLPQHSTSTVINELLRSKFADMYKLVKAGTAECLYYGFATCGNMVLCR